MTEIVPHIASLDSSSYDAFLKLPLCKNGTDKPSFALGLGKYNLVIIKGRDDRGWFPSANVANDELFFNCTRIHNLDGKQSDEARMAIVCKDLVRAYKELPIILSAVNTLILTPVPLSFKVTLATAQAHALVSASRVIEVSRSPLLLVSLLPTDSPSSFLLFLVSLFPAQCVSRLAEAASGQASSSLKLPVYLLDLGTELPSIDKLSACSRLVYFIFLFPPFLTLSPLFSHSPASSPR